MIVIRVKIKMKMMMGVNCLTISHNNYAEIRYASETFLLRSDLVDKIHCVSLMWLPKNRNKENNFNLVDYHYRENSVEFY